MAESDAGVRASVGFCSEKGPRERNEDFAAAVIGGTSLFGGRGKAIHGVLGGLVIGGIYNGMYLQGLDVEKIFIVTGLVLLAAVSIDAVSRRAASSGSAARV